MLSMLNSILFTTEFIPRDTPRTEEWWYFGLDLGQHASFSGSTLLSSIVKGYNLNLYSDCTVLHLMTKRRIASCMLTVLLRLKVTTLLKQFFRRKSFLQDDYQKIMDRICTR